MTKSKLLTAISGVAVASTVSAGAVYDTNNYSGNQPTEMHMTSYTNDGGCAGFCITFNGANGQQTTPWNVANQSPGIVDASGNVTSPNVADDFKCNILGEPDSANAKDASGNCLVDRFGAISYTPDNVGESSSSSIDVIRVNLQSDAEGKITGGWFLTAAVFSGIDFHVYLSFTSGAACSWERGDATVLRSLIDNNDLDAGATPTDASQGCVDLDLSSTDTGSGPAILTTWSASGMKYGTCDSRFECGQFSKSVPVPAFAAATLGLGLLGITYLTGRRQKIR